MSELLSRVAESWTRLDQRVHALSNSQLTTTGPDDWSAQDHLAHLSAWEESLIALLEGRDRGVAIDPNMGEAGSSSHDVDAINAFIQRRSKDRSVADVLAAFEQTHRRVVSTLTRLTDEDLARPYSYYQPNDRPVNANPVVGWIRGNTYEHYDEHAAWIDQLVTAT